MTNREKYEKEILDIACHGVSFAVNKETNSVDSCYNVGCEKCLFYIKSKSGLLSCCSYTSREEWCKEEYKEPKIDWSKVPVDTKILVSNNELSWYRRYFAKYENDKVYTYRDGKTSWSSDNCKTFSWKYAKLAE